MTLEPSQKLDQMTMKLYNEVWELVTHELPDGTLAERDALYELFLSYVADGIATELEKSTPQVVERQFCDHCRAGVGEFRREGEGTCQECDPSCRLFIEHLDDHLWHRARAIATERNELRDFIHPTHPRPADVNPTDVYDELAAELAHKLTYNLVE